jgi:hypothetical protein
MAAIVCLLLATLFWSPPTQADERIEVDNEWRLPPQLQPWVDWIEQARPQRVCRHGDVAGEWQPRCHWPGQLELQVDGGLARFRQSWLVELRGWIPLPGELDHWPTWVSVNGERRPLSAREGRPGLTLEAGRHTLEGELLLRADRSHLTIPPATGLLSLTINGQSVEAPQVDDKGRIRLFGGQAARTPGSEREADRLTLNVARLIEDEVPMEIESRFQLRVAGQAREEVIDNALPLGFLPFRYSSPLPMRIENASNGGGALRLQLRPGVWEIVVLARATRSDDRIDFYPVTGSETDGEVWSFRHHPELRQVEIDPAAAGPQIDPQQTRVPAEWHRYPTYLMERDHRFILTERSRGDPTPAPNQIRLEREMWLDFSGQGYSLRDAISGVMHRNWRLRVDEPLQLGRALVDGQGRVVTRDEDGNAGIELRHEQIDLVAESRIEGGIGSPPVNGWSEPLDSISVRLHLPPGWSLLAVDGADSAPGAWISRWTLLDLFLVLVVAAAVYRLWGIRWGAAATMAMVLTIHDGESPTTLWLLLLLTAALLRVVRSANPRLWLLRIHQLAGLMLIVILLPWSIDQVRTALYPQLDWPDPASRLQAQVAVDAEMDQPAVPAASAPQIEARVAQEAQEYLYLKRSASPEKLQKRLQFDPRERVQTGPGLPQWQGRIERIGFSGPVGRGDNLSILYLTPNQNRLVILLKLLFVTLLAYRLLDNGNRFGEWGSAWSGRKVALTAMATLLLPILIQLPQTAEASTPLADDSGRSAGNHSASALPEGVFSELERRLNRPASCAPGCVTLLSTAIDADGSGVMIEFTLHAEQRGWVELPVDPTLWMPASLDQASDSRWLPAVSRRNANRRLEVAVEAGEQRLRLRGATVTHGQELQLPGLTSGRALHQVTLRLDGWTAEGVRNDATAPGHITLRRLAAGGAIETEQATLEPSRLPPFLRLERRIVFGLEWEIESRISRLSQGTEAITTRVPLLGGESINTPGITRDGNEATIRLAPGESSKVWRSTLARSEQVELVAVGNPFREIWQVEIGPAWRLRHEGLAELNASRGDRPGPTWRPRPGERVILYLSRPEPVDGAVTTLQSSLLELRPGERIRETKLSAAILASQGGVHTIRLPAGSIPTAVSVNGKSEVVDESRPEVDITLQPGEQRVDVAWRSEEPFATLLTTPRIDPGLAAINTTLRIVPPEGRWVLWVTGPANGPAILFWGALVVVVLSGWLLGRFTESPLSRSQWIVLGIGLLPVSVAAYIVVAGWMIAAGQRRNRTDELLKQPAWIFNTIQVGLLLFTVIAISALLDAIHQGLLGYPDMQIEGSGSWRGQLQWFEDRSPAGENNWPVAGMVSVPLWLYRLAMLAWSLWLALRIIEWAGHGWQAWSSGRSWRPFDLKLVDRNRTGAEKRASDGYNKNHTESKRERESDLILPPLPEPDRRSADGENENTRGKSES